MFNNEIRKYAGPIGGFCTLKHPPLTLKQAHDFVKTENLRYSTGLLGQSY